MQVGKEYIKIVRDISCYVRILYFKGLVFSFTAAIIVIAISAFFVSAVNKTNAR
jgi:hypothetical protein